jgi:hypothetical protein
MRGLEERKIDKEKGRKGRKEKEERERDRRTSKYERLVDLYNKITEDIHFWLPILLLPEFRSARE